MTDNMSGHVLSGYERLRHHPMYRVGIGAIAIGLVLFAINVALTLITAVVRNEIPQILVTVFRTAFALCIVMEAIAVTTLIRKRIATPAVLSRSLIDNSISDTMGFLRSLVQGLVCHRVGRRDVNRRRTG